MFSTVIDYYASLKMGKCKAQKQKNSYLILSLCTNLGLLFAFKYFNFASDSVREIFNMFNIFYDVPYFKLLLPVGISFYTFQTLSYTIDVYRGKKDPEKHFGIFALYVSFFPQLVAGPIERSTRLLPQFYKKHEFDYDRVIDGLKLMLWGFFKKIVIADRLSMLVNTVYNDPTNYHGFPFILATVFFAFQIYCDFSGYSDIAIGSAQVLGFNLTDNFKRPYFSKSIAEFWKRWHISLSTWFRDYLYIPLGGNRCLKWRWYFNLFIVFLISGLWHGANWTFAIWGGLNGFYLIFAIWTNKVRTKIAQTVGLTRLPTLHKYFRVLVTFSLINFAWIFFRSDTVSDAFYIVRSIFVGIWEMIMAVVNGNLAQLLKLLDITHLGLGDYELIIAFGAIMFMEFVHLIQRHRGIRNMMRRRPIWIRWSVYYIMIFGILIFGVFGKQEFIYFQF